LSFVETKKEKSTNPLDGFRLKLPETEEEESDSTPLSFGERKTKKPTNPLLLAGL
jgi:hypothetical protein